ncbi:hypothetical protein CTAYLR_005488 [Chrysophaeum taylorii]|uniref:RRM domain-containing protein n=1 Tax=Chrysophaeum taylorii TaxID=2483200 RepID=A0AAD7U4R3_9STRA|nr:hypothetical protein CTAYLR_005488 [Chrysophaeum taylorii]
MPEYAELHSSAHQVRGWSQGQWFTRIEAFDVAPPEPPLADLDEATRLKLTAEIGASGPGQRLLKAISAKRPPPTGRVVHSGRFGLWPCHRGKEVCVIVVDAADTPWGCATCKAARGEPPACPDHGAMRLTSVWRCQRCRLVYVPEADHPQPEIKLMELTFRRGMSGKFRLTNAADSATQVAFFREDGKVIAFCDRRRRVGDRAIWHVGGFSEWRSPDPVRERDAWRSNVLSRLDEPAFDHPVAEVLLDQAFFNGVGNYLRAEILDRAGRVPPFALARTAAPRILDAVVDTLRRSVVQKRLQLRVFRMRFASRALDAHGRTVWYRGDRGELPGPKILDAPWSRVAFARVPRGTEKSDVEAWFQQHGDLLTFWFNAQKGYGAVRYASLDQAQRAVAAAAAKDVLLFGGRVQVTFKRRLRKPSAAVLAAAGGGGEEEEEERPPSSTDEDSDTPRGHHKRSRDPYY